MPELAGRIRRAGASAAMAVSGQQRFQPVPGDPAYGPRGRKTTARALGLTHESAGNPTALCHHDVPIPVAPDPNRRRIVPKSGSRRGVRLPCGRFRFRAKKKQTET